MPRSAGPLFVIGVWRSGTSLLYALLNQHSQIALMYEGDILRLQSLFVFGRNPNWGAKWNFWNAAIERHGLQFDADMQDAGDCRAAFASTCQQYASKRGADLWGEKSPYYYDRLIKLHSMWPTARFVVIWRHPVNILRSLRNAERSSSWNVSSSAALLALVGMERLKNDCDRLRGRGVAVHEVRYEDLTANPEMCLRRVCEFLGVAYSPRMTSLADADRSAIFDGEHHGLVKGTSIVNSEREAAALPPALEVKAARYLRRWERIFGQEWLDGTTSSGSAAGEPRLAERLSDRLGYECLRAADACVRLAFGVVPLSLWKRYRMAKQQMRRAAQDS